MPKYAINDKAVSILRGVKRLILNEPRRFDMTSWVRRKDGPPCGTAACIAGWILLADKTTEELAEMDESKAVSLVGAHCSRTPARKAARRMGMGGHLFRLFLLENWPEPYLTKYEMAGIGSLESAKVAANRIEHFIRTGK